jgi:hypothetical protein
LHITRGADKRIEDTTEDLSHSIHFKGPRTPKHKRLRAQYYSVKQKKDILWLHILWVEFRACFLGLEEAEKREVSSLGKEEQKPLQAFPN